MDDDRQIIPVEERKWCLLIEKAGCGTPLCTGEVFGGGEGDATADVKSVKRGGVTCPQCLEEIKWIKSIRL